MCKKFFSLLMLCVMTRNLVAEEVETQDSTRERASVEIQDKAVEKLVSFEVKNSIVFEDFVKSLSAEFKAELQDFIKKTEQSLLNNVEFAELVKRYNDLFTALGVKKESPRATLTFSFDRENWVDLVKQEQLNIDALKNTLSEDQVIKLNEELVAMAASLEKITIVVLAELENSNLRKELKEKSNNQRFRIGLILA